MTAIMEHQPTPSIMLIKRRSAKWSQLRTQSIQSIIMTGSSVGYVPWKLGVIQFIRVYGAVEDGSDTLVDMKVAGEDEVDGVLMKYGFKRFLALCADGPADVPGAMTG